MPTRSASGQTWTGRTAHCLHCGASHTFTEQQIRRDEAELDMVPCGGSDACHAMLCPTCRHSCPLCGNATCAEHLRKADDTAGVPWCEVCRMQYCAEVALETQDIAQFLAACAAAGLTLDETRALGKFVN